MGELLLVKRLIDARYLSPLAYENGISSFLKQLV
jgi:hypothetical protein